MSKCGWNDILLVHTNMYKVLTMTTNFLEEKLEFIFHIKNEETLLYCYLIIQGESEVVRLNQKVYRAVKMGCF